jgi:hypothetical protein
MEFGPRWTEEEKAKLRESYLRGGTTAAMEALPCRSESAIWQKASRLGLVSPHYWTEKEDDRLRWLWGNAVSLTALARKLKRSANACYERAGQLGLRSRGFKGCESLEASSKRVGFSPRKLEKILRQYEVPLRPAYARPGLSKGLKRARFVDSYDVDRAVTAWMRDAP